ncbi:MAG: HAD-IA family hydrolase [Planctomycetes bacterium]|nr:HAD-IA family hydrolase [Planctomycetota bacterium]
MSLDARDIDAVVFDYGNTLIEFAAPQVQQLDRAIASAIAQAIGPFDLDLFIALRKYAYRAAYGHPELREVTMHEQMSDILTKLFGRAPAAAQLESVLEVHDRVFVDTVQAPDYVHDLLAKLAARYTLAMISNYPCGKSIRASLERTGIAPHLKAVVVSGEVGHVKPHPLPFKRVLREVGVAPDRAVYIGDNWLGDIQGAKRAGLFAVHITQFDTLEVFDREDGHHDADLTIAHLSELADHLL